MLERILDEAHARQLPALIAEWERTTDERFWLARALRIDLALLVERPALVVPCLYRRCAHLGAEHDFYAERPPPPADFTALRALVAGWAEDTPRPWLRAARPIPTPLDGALREEYRGAVGATWASRDGAWLGAVGPPRVAWERATGRRLADANIVDEPSPAPRPWTFMGAESSFVLARDDTHLEIVLDDGLRALSAVTLSDDLVVVHGDEPWESPIFFVVDTRAGRVRWRGTDEPQTLAVRDDTLVATFYGNLLRVYDLATGVVRRAASLPGTGIMLLGDGALVSRGNRIGVWDFTETRSVRLRAHGNVDVSLDGARVVTGTLLCDVRTGRVIADLPLYRPRSQWHDSQLPRTSRRIAGDVFAELSPDGLARWRLVDGAALPVIRARVANGLDHCAWDPQGCFVAVWSSSYALAIWSLEDGAEVARFTQRHDGRRQPFGFSADGAQLVWGAANGVIGVHLAAPTQIVPMNADRIAARPPAVRTRGGLLVAGDAVIPCDGTMIATPDGRAFVSCEEHYVLEEP